MGKSLVLQVPVHVTAKVLDGLPPADTPTRAGTHWVELAIEAQTFRIPVDEPPPDIESFIAILYAHFEEKELPF